MNYQKHYDKLIKRARNRLLETYIENHHIIPKCMNGSNDAGNIVALTPEEHYVAHQLLIKIYPNKPKLVYAANMMAITSLNQPNRNNKLYGWLRRKHAKSISELNKNRVPWNKGLTKEIDDRLGSGMLGKTHSIETNQKRSNSMKGEKNHFYGKKHTEESKKLMGHPIGTKQSEKTKQKRSKSLKGKPWSEARRAAQKEKRKK